MHIQTVAKVEEISLKQVIDKTVIVIDVLRASSTIVTALASGFTSVIPVQSADEAFALHSFNNVLAGEWHCKKREGFEYNNSPVSIRKKDHTGKHLILTTTNGTRAIEKARKADSLFIGCFLNASACMNQAMKQHRDITIYCAGTRNEFALEDGLAAGFMVHLAKKQTPSIEICDFSEAMESCYLQLAHRLPNLLYTTTTGKRLVKHQYTEDIDYCSQIDLLQIVPIEKENRILSCSDT
ncbi:2-phosphosulfolactate phosphatase [Bacillus sp. 03113]|uniref:2-phosphosulfolactate phosphatase n=1 Tax=Bacillus sp. 03113 TaxID=2578211 RepID=UPI001143A64C|nr:2-phosphosulfolactate phosphatase [Bacillus sp. 03113]